ncbi:hypothetical protein L0337_41890 [candidate division KSB1 bacterium]|nr:hypothetical protein [candidate division KSB1 bacterium]
MPIFASSASKAAIEVASDVHNWELAEGLGQLVELWLLEASERLDESKRRYSLHPLTRAFAQNKLSEHPDLERDAKLRLVNFFEYISKSAGGDILAWKNYDEIELEKDNIFALTDWCFENQQEMAGMRLTKSVTYFMGLRGYLSESLKFGRIAAKAVRQANEHTDLAWLLVHGIGWREIHGGNLETGESYFVEALRIYENLNDKKGIMAVLGNLGRALQYKKDFINARHYCERGLSLAQSLGDELAIARFKKELSMLAASEGRLQEAKAGLESVLVMLEKQNPLIYASALSELAEVNRKLNDYETAYLIGIKGLELAIKMKRQDTIGWVSRTLAYTEVKRGNLQSAKSHAETALEFFAKPGLHFEESEELKKLLIQLNEKLCDLSKLDSH